MLLSAWYAQISSTLQSLFPWLYPQEKYALTVMDTKLPPSKKSIHSNNEHTSNIVQHDDATVRSVNNKKNTISAFYDPTQEFGSYIIYKDDEEHAIVEFNFDISECLHYEGSDYTVQLATSNTIAALAYVSTDDICYTWSHSIEPGWYTIKTRLAGFAGEPSMLGCKYLEMETAYELCMSMLDKEF